MERSRQKYAPIEYLYTDQNKIASPTEMTKLHLIAAFSDAKL
jgi:hypothetical protein